jgi:hypothetical protein
MQWLQDAKQSCLSNTYAHDYEFYGGPAFIENDQSTYWTDANQFINWWKNNVERRQKYHVISKDAEYLGVKTKKVQRSVALSLFCSCPC